MSETWVWRGSTALLAIAVVILLVIIGNMVQTKKGDEEKETIDMLNQYFNPPQYGVFLNRPPALKGSLGRQPGGLEDTVIILENTNYNDTIRWLNGIIKSRKSPNDLLVYVYKTKTEYLTEFMRLRKEIRTNPFYVGVDITPNNRSVLVNDVLKRTKVEYLIDITDKHYMGFDFADYYYLGKNVMKSDEQIDCVCGGEDYSDVATDEFTKPSQGDILWLSEITCSHGMMTTRDKYQLKTEKAEKSNFCLRPEVWRVSDANQHVTKMSWNLAEFDPSLLTVKAFKKRLEYDFEHAVRLQKVEWTTPRSTNIEKVYMFPYEGESDLMHYFDEEELDVATSKVFEDNFMMHFDGHQIYFVPGHVFRNETNVIEENKKEDSEILQFFL